VIPILLLSIVALLLLVVGLSVANVVRVASNNSVSALASLARALIWPAAILFIVVLFQDPITAFLDRLSRVTIKAGGAETTLEAAETRAKVTALLTAAESEASPADGAASPSRAVSPDVVTTSAANAARVIDEQTVSKFRQGSILWVDNHPENNRYLIRAFRELGIHVDLPTSTDAAMAFLRSRAYDVIITDMSRPPDPRAGYTLLKALHDEGNRTPVIIYAGSDSDDLRREAIAAGAIDSTNSPQRVFNLATTFIISKFA
jgi:CheY-like chemotaxis protein